MADAILVLNAGSSSLKFALFSERGELTPELRGLIEGLGGEGAPHLVARRGDGGVAAERRWPERAYLGHSGTLEALLPLLRDAPGGEVRLAGVGHRVVHGGTAFSAPVVIDEAVLARLQSFVPLAPLHQPNALAVIRAMRELDPSLPQVASFDTAFHRTMPPMEDCGRPLQLCWGSTVCLWLQGTSPTTLLNRMVPEVRTRIRRHDIWGKRPDSRSHSPYWLLGMEVTSASRLLSEGRT